MMDMRGMYRRLMPCWVSEKTPEISACEATTVAAVAIPTRG